MEAIDRAQTDKVKFDTHVGNGQVFPMQLIPQNYNY